MLFDQLGNDSFITGAFSAYDTERRLYSVLTLTSICLRIVFNLPLLVFKGVYHYWTYIFHFFSMGPSQQMEVDTPSLAKRDTFGFLQLGNPRGPDSSSEVLFGITRGLS